MRARRRRARAAARLRPALPVAVLVVGRDRVVRASDAQRLRPAAPGLLLDVLGLLDLALRTSSLIALLGLEPGRPERGMCKQADALELKQAAI